MIRINFRGVGSGVIETREDRLPSSSFITFILLEVLLPYDHPYVRPMISFLVGWLVLCHIFLKWREVTLPFLSENLLYIMYM